MKIGVLQPHIPHYREEFFRRVKEKFNCDIFCYQDTEQAKNNNFKDAHVESVNIKSIEYYGFLWYNPFVFKKCDILVLMLHFGHLTTWLLLLTKFIHKKRVVVWGQGISVKRYLKEEQKPNILLKWMLAMADGAWLYTEKEKNKWEKIFPNKNMIALGNTITGIEEIVNYQPIKSKLELKTDYNISQEICLIFCARFNNNYRRQDLLLEVIEKLDKNKYGFVIIGDGPVKPNFSIYNNVYDFGAVYDIKKKQDLFTIADLYIQPGWVGLSIVEAMGYGKPIITFKRSKEVLQCVEYYYLTNNDNAIIVEAVDELILKIECLQSDEIKKLQQKAKRFVTENLMMQSMVDRALITLKNK